MKKILFVLVVKLLCLEMMHAQENRFNIELDKFCKISIKEFRTLPRDRKIILDGMAQQLVNKKYVLFTCRTNSRRTVMLQVWAQTAFYYYGLNNKLAFSIGDTVTNVYAGVVDVLSASGFSCSKQPNGYVIAINAEYPINILSSKNEIGTIDTAKGIVVNICYADEQSNLAAKEGHVNLPYQSPAAFENTVQEKQKYVALNHQIALEMLYLAQKTKDIILESETAY